MFFSILSLSALHDNGVTYVLCKNLKLHFAVEAQYHVSFTYTYLLCEMENLFIFHTFQIQLTMLKSSFPSLFFRVLKI